MKQQLFENQHQALWQAFAKRLTQLEGDKPPADGIVMLDSAEFPAAYRRICQHLALARERRYSSRLTDYLGELALRGYQQIYRAPQSRWAAIVEFLLAGFPRLVRREWRLFWLCSALFYLPLLAMGYAVYAIPETIYSLLDYATVAEFESMYQDAVVSSRRESESDLMMLGHYIYNNIGIGFRTFAAGILFGIGSIFVLVFNGVFIGAIAGYIAVRGYADTFFSFVIGHGAFELTAIVLAGVSGLRLGLALVKPGSYTRYQALRLAAATSIQIVYGVITLLLLAAFIEAFWSSGQLPHSVKYAVGGSCWLLVIAYLCLAGRDAT